MNYSKQINYFIHFSSFFIFAFVILNTIGWIYGISLFVNFGVNLPLMSLWTAICFCFLALSLLSLRKAANSTISRWICMTLSICLTVFATIALSDIEKDFSFLNQKIIFYSSPQTAMLFLLSALAIFSETSTLKYKHMLSQLLALIIFSIILLVIISYCVNASGIYQASDTLGISFGTSLGFIFFSLALFFCFPNSGVRQLYSRTIHGSGNATIFNSVCHYYSDCLCLYCAFIIRTTRLTHASGDVLTSALIMAFFVYCMYFLRKQIDMVESLFKIMTNVAPVMMWMANTKGDTNYFNAEWLSFTGRSLSNEAKINHKSCIHADDFGSNYAVYNKAFKAHQPFSMEYRLQHHSGEYHWILEKGSPYWGLNNEFKGFIGICTDINEQKKASEKMQLASHVFEHSVQGIMITDTTGHIVMTNPAFTELTGYSADEVLNKHPSFLKSGTHEDEFYHQVWEKLTTEQYWHGEIWSRRKNGELFLEELSINTVLDKQGKVINYIGIFTDITQRKLNEEHYQYLAHYDPLTDLPNRTLLTDRIEQALTQASRYQHKIAVLFIDLDKFKPINDELGHHIGDLLLKEVALRLKNTIRQEDTAARLGGDEFVILLTAVNDKQDVIQIVEKILEAISKPYHLEGHTLNNHCSIGITISSEHDDTMKALLKNSDTAMYNAKKSTTLRYAFFDK